MSKIHISLVGGQPTPIYQGILYTQPDFIHLICSKNSLEQAGVIRKELPIFSDNQVQEAIQSIFLHLHPALQGRLQ